MYSPTTPLTGYVGSNKGNFSVLAIDLCPRGGISSFSEPRRLKVAYYYTTISYSEVPHGRGISENK